MNRRGHMSFKIPNVKLRPAPAPDAPSRAKARAAERAISPLRSMMDEEILRQAMEGEEDEDMSTAALRTTNRPWSNVVITFTGVENKTQLTQLARELGANVESALTISVTHVVAVGFASPKYHYAVSHRLPIMRPQWIEECHQRWLSAEELNMDDDINYYRLLPFSGLTIAISGIEPLERRKQIVAAISAHGGEYRKDLDRTCSHLVSAKPTSDAKSSEKVKWAVAQVKERDMARRRGKKLGEGEDMRIVYEEWIWDCVAFRGRWKEEDYDARKPRGRGKIRAEDVINGTVVFEDSKPEVPKSEAVENEPAALRKRKREGMSSLVGEIISTTAVKTEQDEPQEGETSDVFSDAQARDTPTRASSGRRKASLLHASRTTSFSAGPSKLSIVYPEIDPSMPATAPVQPTSHGQADGNARGQIFAGLRISHLIDESPEGLQGALRQHGAELVSEEERLDGQEVDFVVVRLSSSARPCPVENVKSPAVVTECWVEACCFEQDLLPIDKHLVFQPLPASMPISGTSTFNIHLSGYSADQSTYLRRLVRVIGATIATSMNRLSTHLVTNRSSGPKYDKALEWGLEVLSEEWLLEMGRTGQVAVPHSFRVAKTSGPVPNTSAGPSQARSLKLAPTHIDASGSSTIPGFSSSTSIPNADTLPPAPAASNAANPLSPPRAETARRLNHADVDNIAYSSITTVLAPTSSPHKGKLATGESQFESSTSHKESASSKLGRSSSAPNPGSSPNHRDLDQNMDQDKESSFKGREMTLDKERNVIAKAATTESLQARGMTEVLKRLAEKGDSTPVARVKAPRRTRPSGRFKSVTHSPATTSTSPERPLFTPNTEYDHRRNGVSRSHSRQGSSPPSESHMMMMDRHGQDIDMGAGIGGDPSGEFGLDPQMGEGADESIRVHVVDPKGDKERKRLIDAMHRRSVELSRDAGVAAPGRGGVRNSPAKRSRR